PDLTILYVTHDQSEALTIADRITVMHESQLVDVGRARDLYQRPPSQFTAGFLGNANLIPVRLEAHDDSAQAARITVNGSSCKVITSGHVDVSHDHVLCVRPHALRLEPDSRCENAIGATVVSVQWLGSLHRIFLDIEGCEVRLDSNSPHNIPERGSRILLHFAADEATLIDTEKG